MDSGIKIEGLDELKKSLIDLNAQFQKKALQSAMVAAAGVLVRAAKKQAQEQGLELSGDLLRNIAMKRERKPKAGTIQYNVGVRHGKGAKKTRKIVLYRGLRKIVYYENDPWYWWFHEFGTSKMPPRPFIRPAFEASQQLMISAMTAKLRKSIEKYKAKS